MTIRELFVKIRAITELESFQRADAAAENVKRSLERVAQQNRNLPTTFSRVRQALQGVSQDFSALTQALEKHRMVFAGLGVAVGAIATKAGQAALDFEKTEHQLRRIAGTEEGFARLQQAVARVREETRAFTTRELMQEIRSVADETGLALDRLLELLPAVGKIAAAQGETISETFMKLRTVAVTGTIRASLASVLGQEETVRLRQRFQEIDKAAKDLNLSLEEVTERKFDLLVESVQRAVQGITKPVSDSQAAFVQFREALDNFNIALGQRILPAVTKVLGVLTSLIEAINRAPAAIRALADVLLALAGLTVFNNVLRIFRALSSTAGALMVTFQNLGLRVAMVLEAFGATGAANRLLNLLIAFRHPITTLRSLFAGLAATVARVGPAFAGAMVSVGGLRGVFVGVAGAVRALGPALATLGRGLLATLGPIRAVAAAVTSLMWLFEKLWDKISGKEHAEAAAKAFRERAVTILEKSRAEIEAKLKGLAEEQRQALEEAFAKIPYELQAAAQELGAEEFVKLNINTKPVQNLISEIRKGRIESEALATELSKIIIGSSKQLEGVAKAQKETLAEVVRQYKQGFLDISQIQFDRELHQKVLAALRELKVPDVLWQAYTNLSTETAALIQQRFKVEGTGWLRELAEKMRAEKPTLRKAIEELTEAIAEYIPQSPAKRGPLSRIHLAGQAMTRTIAASLVSARPRLEQAMQKLVPELKSVAVDIVLNLPRNRDLAKLVPELPTVIQRVRRIAEDVPGLSTLVQKVQRVVEDVPGRLFLPENVLAGPALAPVAAGVGGNTLVFSPHIVANVSVEPRSGWSEKELATEIATQTGYALWQQVKPHWEMAMLRILRSFKRHEAPDVKGQQP